jgi:UDP-N-acetyl-D-mannosaminuronic acid dehydrogenase
VGLGYVGLPTACMLAVSGVDVLGVDASQDVLDSLRKGNPNTAEAEVQSLVNLAIHSGKLTFASSPESCDAFIIAVPTPVFDDHTGDLSHVRAAVAAVAEVVRPGSLIVLESTVPPGTVESVVVPELRARVKEWKDILVAHCPERVLPGATLVELVNNDRIIGGLDALSAQRAAELYSIFVRGQIHLTDLTTAEMVKVMENTYRDVNIALANEFAMLSERIGVDVWEAIRLANNHPRVKILRPGPGVGGHCIAVDPWFLVGIDPERSRLVRAARDVNDGMPLYVVERLLKEAKHEKGHVALLGLAYRAELSDTRESPALEIHHLLRQRGVEVKAHDPLAAGDVHGITNHTLTEALTGAGSILLVTDHRAFVNIDPTAIADLVGGRTVFDTRGCLDAERWRNGGFRVITLGKVPIDGD